MVIDVAVHLTHKPSQWYCPSCLAVVETLARSLVHLRAVETLALLLLHAVFGYSRKLHICNAKKCMTPYDVTFVSCLLSEEVGHVIASRD